MMHEILFFFIFVITIIVMICICRRVREKFPVLNNPAMTTTLVSVPNNTTYHLAAPYPVNASAMPQPSPYGGYPSVPVGVSPAVYPPQPPYPTNPNMGMPLPMTNNAPYPPNVPNSNTGMGPSYPRAPGENVQQNPPTYAEATGIYERQSAFNPNFK